MKFDYRIDITSIPSNLGKGEVLYFVCPESGKRCRILYGAYGSYKWKAREAYNNTLYYHTQIVSKMDYANRRYWELEKIETEKYLRLFYDGEPTRKAK